MVIIDVLAPPEFIKDPQAVLDYKLNLGKFWLTTSEVVTSGAAVVSPAELGGVVVDLFEFNATSVTAWLSGGIINRRYEVIFHWVTNQGRADDRSVIIFVRER